MQTHNESSLSVRHGEVSKVLSSFAVDVVLETLWWMEKDLCQLSFSCALSQRVPPPYRMISVQLGAVHQDTVGAFVQV